MKKVIVLVAAFLFVVSGVVFAQITGTKHDLSSGGVALADKSTDVDKKCVFCHSPHPGASVTKPLWNKAVPAGPYQVYGGPSDLNPSATFDAGVSGQNTAADFTATDISALCFSCHDGVSAVNSIINIPTDIEPGPGLPAMGSGTELTAAGLLLDATKILGTDLTNDHPVNFDYNAALVAADALTGGSLLAPPATLPYFGTAPAVQVQCATCHNVHDGTFQDFLRLDNTGSALCGQCHGQL